MDLLLHVTQFLVRSCSKPFCKQQAGEMEVLQSSITNQLWMNVVLEMLFVIKSFLTKMNSCDVKCPQTVKFSQDSVQRMRSNLSV